MRRKFLKLEPNFNPLSLPLGGPLNPFLVLLEVTRINYYTKTKADKDLSMACLQLWGTVQVPFLKKGREIQQKH